MLYNAFHQSNRIKIPPRLVHQEVLRGRNMFSGVADPDEVHPDPHPTFHEKPDPYQNSEKKPLPDLELNFEKKKGSRSGSNLLEKNWIWI